MQKLVEDFKTHDSAKFDAYYVKNAVREDDKAHGKLPPLVTCDCTCKASHVCAIEFIDLDEYEDCIDKPTAYVCPGAGGGGGGGGASILKINFALLLIASGILSLLFVR